MTEEDKLRARLLAKKPGADEKFRECFSPRLRRVAEHVLGRHDPEIGDAVAETFSAVQLRLENGGPGLNGFPMLRRICVALCYGRLLRRRRLLVQQEEVLARQIKCQALELEPDPNLDSQRQMRRKIFCEAKTRLPGPHRHIIELQDEQGLSYAQIHQKLELPMGLVLSRLALARDLMLGLAHQAAAEAGLELGAS